MERCSGFRSWGRRVLRIRAPARVYTIATLIPVAIILVSVASAIAVGTELPTAEELGRWPVTRPRALAATPASRRPLRWLAGMLQQVHRSRLGGRQKEFETIHYVEGAEDPNEAGQLRRLPGFDPLERPLGHTSLFGEFGLRQVPGSPDDTA